MDFHNRLEAATERTNKSELSRAAGLPANTVSNLLNSRRLPRVDTLVALAEVLGVGLDDLVFEEPPELAASKGKLTDVHQNLLSTLIAGLGSVHVREKSIRYFIEVVKPVHASEQDQDSESLLNSAAALEFMLSFDSPRLAFNEEGVRKLERFRDSMKFRGHGLARPVSLSRAEKSVQQIVADHEQMFDEIDHLKQENEELEDQLRISKEESVRLMKINDELIVERNEFKRELLGLDTPSA